MGQLAKREGGRLDAIVDAELGEVDVPIDEGAPRGGRVWRLVEAPAAVTFLGSRFEGDRRAQGRLVFRFRVLRGGDHVVRFEQRRAWEAEPLASRAVMLRCDG